jgi:hypothetical protein
MSPGRLAVSIGAIALAAGCVEGEEPAGHGALQIAESAAGVRGSYEDDSAAALGRVEFRAERAGPDVLEIEVELDGGLLLLFVIDHLGGVVEIDGYDALDGRDRELTLADRALLRAFTGALDVLGRHVRPELATLRDLTSLWSEFPAGMEMQLGLLLPAERGSASTCSRLNSYVRGTHDGWFEYRWSDRTTLDAVYLSTHAACRSLADEDTQGTWWWIDGAWRCPTSEPNHSTSIEHAYGACFGRCGVGCGRGSVYTWGCLDHDVCNRFGHSWAASVPGGHCSDEFSVAAAELLTEPSCY